MFPVLSKCPRAANPLRLATYEFPAIVRRRRVRVEPGRATSPMGCLVVAFVVVVAGAPPSDGASPLRLRIEKGQEFVFRGNYSETVNRPGAKLSQTYAVESYVFILSQGPNGADAAFLTVQRPAKQNGQEVLPVARMELGKVDDLGRIKFTRKNSCPRVPPEGPPNLETRAFVELPASGEI